ncbi:hypothetical protein FRB94_002784 [Tulasnella sp. JGI-2019a]|nr:hypothetical protein FRB94_002784 [Tulasnella sp. JGI-2019a]
MPRAIPLCSTLKAHVDQTHPSTQAINTRTTSHNSSNILMNFPTPSTGGRDNNGNKNNSPLMPPNYAQSSHSYYTGGSLSDQGHSFAPTVLAPDAQPSFSSLPSASRSSSNVSYVPRLPPSQWQTAPTFKTPSNPSSSGRSSSSSISPSNHHRSRSTASSSSLPQEPEHEIQPFPSLATAIEAYNIGESIATTTSAAIFIPRVQQLLSQLDAIYSNVTAKSESANAAQYSQACSKGGWEAWLAVCYKPGTSACDDAVKKMDGIYDVLVRIGGAEGVIDSEVDVFEWVRGVERAGAMIERLRKERERWDQEWRTRDCTERSNRIPSNRRGDIMHDTLRQVEQGKGHQDRVATALNSANRAKRQLVQSRDVIDPTLRNLLSSTAYRLSNIWTAIAPVLATLPKLPTASEADRALKLLPKASQALIKQLKEIAHAIETLSTRIDNVHERLGRAHRDQTEAASNAELDAIPLNFKDSAQGCEARSLREEELNAETMARVKACDEARKRRAEETRTIVRPIR